MPQRITFYSDAIQLVGYLHEPAPLAPSEQRPAVLVCHGFGASQDRVLPEVAAHLASQGYIALTIDYRGFGESQGPRWRMIPQEQVVDIRNALTYLETLPIVDRGTLGLWGTSFGGANAAYVAAVDKRVACTVSVVAVGNGERWIRSLRRAWEWRDLKRELEEDWRSQVITGKSRMVDRTYLMLPDPASERAIEATLAAFPDMCREIPLETARAVIDFRPDDLVHQISPRPILFIVAGNDGLVLNELTRELYDRAGEPKKWAVLPGLEHYETYSPEHLPKTLGESADWFQRWMPAKA
ncbi:MAG TPA: alpha/beta fold hydrolase [Chloroflexota bacterium]|nr:alpha/beta fold hydrolase [Chloroflexota bacterium]